MSKVLLVINYPASRQNGHVMSCKLNYLLKEANPLGTGSQEHRFSTLSSGPTPSWYFVAEVKRALHVHQKGMETQVGTVVKKTGTGNRYLCSRRDHGRCA